MDAIVNSMMVGEITIVTGIFWCAIAMVVGVIGGAIGGIIVGGEHLGYELAAMMGGFFGPTATVPGAFLALIFLRFI